MSGRPDNEHRLAIPAEGHVAILLGVSIEMVASISNGLDQCWNSICSCFYFVLAKQACRGRGFQNQLLVLVIETVAEERAWYNPVV